MNQSARDKMLKARSELVLDHPFFASMALRLDMREDASCATAWSDGRVLAYNPRYIEAVSLERVKGLQCHEVLHLACCHHTRRGERDPKLWNMACDYAINPILLEAGIKLPTGFLDDPNLYGKSADAIYAELRNRFDEIKGGAESGSGLGEAETDEQAEVESTRGQGKETGDQDRSEAAPGEDGPQGDQDNAGGDNNDSAGDGEENSDPGMSGEVRDAAVESKSMEGRNELRREEDSWRMALAQAVNKARQSGEMPGSLERLVSEMLSPRLDWRELLRRFLSNTAKNDFSWVRPNRRYVHAGLYLPGLENQELAELAVAVDVSGSITQAELDRFATELSAVLEEFDTMLTVFTCDAALTSRERLGRWDLPLDFQAKGGGGTDFRPPFKRLDRDGIVPACLIYFTDLESSWYPEDPGYPVLWITPNRDHAPPPFGEVVVMENVQ